MSFFNDLHDVHIQVNMDNSVSVAYLNKFGGRTHQLDALARQIWLWCLDRNIHVSAAFVAGKTNVEADELSGKDFQDDLEWSLAPHIFDTVVGHFPDMSVDLFASRLTCKLATYVSRRAEPHILAADAFSIIWNDHLFYMSPPFSLMAKILQKMEQGSTEAVVIAPV